MYKSVVEGKGGISAKVVCDSIANGIRITTLELRYPRFILAELNTHRVFSRSSASSRAIPVAKMIEQVENDPAMPIHWGKNQAGMQAKEQWSYPVTNPYSQRPNPREFAWKEAGEIASKYAFGFSQAGYHKQIVNRLLEPFQFMKTVVTSTEWDNFFKLRDHPAAQPEIQELACCMKKAMEKSDAVELEYGGLHLPYVTEAEFNELESEKGNMIACSRLIKASVARCARVSYMKHDNSSPDIEDDIELYNTLVVRPYTMKNGMYLPEDDPIHASPAEHQATPMKIVNVYNHTPELEAAFEQDGVSHIDRNMNCWSGNFRGWVQHRKLLERD